MPDPFIRNGSRLETGDGAVEGAGCHTVEMKRDVLFQMPPTHGGLLFLELLLFWSFLNMLIVFF